MAYRLRPYQEDCVRDIADYVNSKRSDPTVVVAPVAAGKSLIIAEAARLMGDRTLVLQPSKELLEQNYHKLLDLGGEATIYSASCGKKELSLMTYATLGSVKKAVGELIDMGIRNVLIDEAHAGYSPEDGSEFMKFMNELRPNKVIGFTATPCRLKTMSMAQVSFSQLNFITRMRPVYFKSVLHVVQVEEMIRQGFWTPLDYEIWNFDGNSLVLNSTGSEYTSESISRAIKESGLNNLILRRMMMLKDECRSILVFMDSVESCTIASNWLNHHLGDGFSAVVHGGIGKRERTAVVNGFKDGRIRVVLNHSALGTGFDHPGLDCVVFGRPTFSFPTWYQAVGRAVRIKDGKEVAKIVDCCNNCQRFGDVRELSIENYPGYGWGMFGGDSLITNIPMGERVTRADLDRGAHKRRKDTWKPGDTAMPGRRFHPLGNEQMPFGKYRGWKIKSVPVSYLKYMLENMDLTSGLAWIKEYCEYIVKGDDYGREKRKYPGRKGGVRSGDGDEGRGTTVLGLRDERDDNHRLI